jgi:alcohol dehydrogenase class IV
MIVTDQGIRKAKILDRVLSHLLDASRIGVFDDTPPNPNESAVRSAVELYREGGYDGIIAVGGGSAIDLAKGVAVCATHSGSLKHFAAIEGGMSRITVATAPVVAIPTTAGTGSEVGRGAVLILDDGRKVGVLSPYMVPKSAICDPELTLFMSPAFNPPADGIALDGLRRAWSHIERATHTGHDRAARLNMMSASMQGAMAFQKGLGCVHSLSHSLGGINPRLHHGTMNAVFLPAVIEFNKDALSIREEGKLDRVAQVMGLSDVEEIVPAIRDMNRRLGLPEGLKALGITKDLFSNIIVGALADHSHQTNPRVANEADYAWMLNASM